MQALIAPTSTTGRHIAPPRTLQILAGVALLTLCAKIKFPIWPSPVPVSLGTLGVLLVGSTYGLRVGVMTILTYLMIGLIAVPVFAGSSAGLSYFAGPTVGYLVGYALAILWLGTFQHTATSKSPVAVALAVIGANVLIYVPGLIGLRFFAASWAQPLEWGLTPFMVGDGLNLATVMIAVLLGKSTMERIRRSR